MKRDAGWIVSLLTGLLTFLVLHLLFVSAWDRHFAAAPWPGYEESARRGLIEPWFINSPRSLWLTRAAFFMVALVAALGRRAKRWPHAALLWAGGSAGVLATYATTRMPSLPGGALGFVFYPFRILLPVILGTALGELAGRTFLAVRSTVAGESASRR